MRLEAKKKNSQIKQTKKTPSQNNNNNKQKQKYIFFQVFCRTKISCMSSEELTTPRR